MAKGDIWLFPDAENTNGFQWRVIPQDDCESVISLLLGLNSLDPSTKRSSFESCSSEIFEKQSLFSKISPQASYELLHLTAFYSFWLKAHRGTIAAYCVWNAEQQSKDALFFRSRDEIQENGAWLTRAFGGDKWKLVEQYGLTEGEYSAVRSYTDQFYQVINPALRKGPLPKPLQAYNESLLSAFRKLPPYYGIVHRGTSLPPEVLADHEPGKIVTYAAYTSTSKLVNWDSKAWGKQIFTIHSNGVCRDTANIYINDVQEVDCPAGTRFKVLSRKSTANGGLEFEMEALPSN